MNEFKKKLENIFGSKTKEELDEELEEEIISTVKEGHEHGVLLASEANMIHNILEFGDKDAKDIMVHRKQMCCLDGDMTFEEALDFVKESSYSRYPVYLQDIDHMIGVLHIKDMLSFVQNQACFARKLRDLDGILQPVEFVPETHSLNTLFAKMQSKKNHMMVVVDEYGQISGLISMEDILEEIVGNIMDEHDEEEEGVIEELPQNCFSMTGATELSEASEVLGISFTGEFETLNGFLTALLGRIPVDGESYDLVYEDYLFHVVNVKDKVIDNVIVSKR